MASDWRAHGEAKRLSILNAIPKKWQLTSPVPPASKLRDVTEYIRQFLDQREIEITETDAVDIVAQTTSGRWSAVEVAEAFCHRAALAHQLVDAHCLLPHLCLTLDTGQLPPRDLLRRRHRRCKNPRCILDPAQDSSRTTPRPPHQPERPIPHKGRRDHDGLHRLDGHIPRPPR